MSSTDTPGSETPGSEPPSTVDRAFRAALYDTTDASLDTGASLLAADPNTDAELSRRGQELIATAWRRGWQPADVIRIVRRDLDDPHAHLLAQLIRAQAAHDGAHDRARARGDQAHDRADGYPQARGDSVHDGADDRAQARGDQAHNRADDHAQARSDRAHNRAHNQARAREDQARNRAHNPAHDQSDTRAQDKSHTRAQDSPNAQAHRHPSHPRGRRWAAQLDDLPADPPPPTDRFSHATAVLELYRLLLRLPALEPLQEPARRHHRSDSRMLGRIRALLAKAEATGFPEEAEALTAKAQELMARHSVDEALLDAAAPAPDAPGACRIGVEPPYEQAKAVLLDAVAAANHCRAVWNEPFAFSTVVGFEADLEAVELLYTSLLVQAQTAMTKAEAAQRAGGRKRTKTFRQSFLAAYAHRIGTRLASAAETQVSDDLLPVLASREVAVTAATDRMFPETVTTRLRGVSDAAGWTEGAEAADHARVEPRRRLPGRG